MSKWNDDGKKSGCHSPYVLYSCAIVSPILSSNGNNPDIATTSINMRAGPDSQVSSSRSICIYMTRLCDMSTGDAILHPLSSLSLY